MRHPRSCSLLLAGFFLAWASAARAEDSCLVKATFGGKPATLEHCAAALYDEKGVTLFFNEDPIPAEEAAAFQWNSYPKEKDAGGKPRTMLTLGFCPGGAGQAPSSGAVKSVEMSLNHSSSPMLGRQWVFDLPADKELKIEKLSGTLKLGGRLAGKITGAKKSDDLDYSWDIVFDVALPAKAAAAGPSCGS
jgi:hypothetical protein